MKILNILLKTMLVVIIIMTALPFLMSQVSKWQFERAQKRFETFTPSSAHEEKVVGKLLEQFMEVEAGREMAAQMSGIESPKCRKNRTLKEDPQHIPTFEETLKECGLR